MRKQLTHLYGDDADARRFNRQIQLCLALLYLQFGCVLAGWLPGWSMILSAPVLVVRWMLSLHEIFHLRSEREVGTGTRLLLLMLTPLFLGYREMRVIHLGHHRHMATPQDPDFFHIRGSKLSGMLNAMTAPEQMTLRWIRAKGLDASLRRDGLVRLLLFTALVVMSGSAFWWYWLPVRLAFGASYFAFFYCLHRRGNAYGVYAAHLPGWAARVFGILFGQDALLATLHHDLHHDAPRIRALALPQARAETAPATING